MAVSHSNHLPLLFSTDLTGVFAQQPELFYQLIQTLSADCQQIDGLELVPFRFSYQRVIKKLKNYQLPIVGLHGPPTWNVPTQSLGSNLITSLFAAITPSLKTALQLNQELKPRYFLIHEPAFDQPQIRKSLIQHFQLWTETQPQIPKPCLMIENDYRNRSLQISVKKVCELNQQTRTGLMLDLAHLLHQVTGLTTPFSCYQRVLTSDNFDQVWQQLLEQAHQALKQIALAGLHIPLGNTSDALPFALIKNSHWRQLAALIDHHRKKLMVLVIENQHYQTRLNLNKNFLPELIKDKKNKLKILDSNGII